MAIKTKKPATDFVSLVSHQLRAPLTGIMWTAELFSEKEKLTKNGRQYLRNIVSLTKRMDTLVKHLLNVSRIESGRVGIAPEPLNLVEFVNERLRALQSSCKKKGLTFVFTAHPAKLAANTDKSSLDYIFRCVMGNAVGYTPRGGKINITLSSKKHSALLIVKDTGIGIPKKEQARIFEKLFRASNAATAKTDGAGLGLYIASEAAKLLGGKIWFESREGKGSTFYIEISLAAKARAGEKRLLPV